MNKRVKLEQDIPDPHKVYEPDPTERITLLVPIELLEKILAIKKNKKISDKSKTIRYILEWGLDKIKENELKRELLLKEKNK